MSQQNSDNKDDDQSISLSSFINEISFSDNSAHSIAVLEQIEPTATATVTVSINPPANTKNSLDIQTPIQPDYTDQTDNTDNLHPSFALKIAPTIDNDLNFQQLVYDNGFGGYMNDFQQTGIQSVVDLIRFATQYLPAGLNITPAPTTNSSPFPYPNRNSQNNLRIQNNDKDDDKDDNKSDKKDNNDKQDKQDKQVPSYSEKKRKLKLYEVSELLGDDEYCEYALLIRDGGNAQINGYYTCSGRKNDYYMFTHMNNNLAALYRAKNGTWMICLDDELLYGNPLKYDSIGGRDILLLGDLTKYPPPPRCWYSIEGINPPPGVMWVEITSDPMAFIDNDLKQKLEEENLNKQYMSKLKVDLPIQMIDFMFIGPIGFALRIDDDNKTMDVIRIKDDGQAKELGLHYGDMLLKINEEDISQTPDIAFPMLKECIISDLPFEVTFIRKKYHQLVINVQRAGTKDCNGKYVFNELDEYDAPIFIKQDDINTSKYVWKILRLDHDEDDGQSIWGIQNVIDHKEYYIGISESYSPPNNSWEVVDNGIFPSPGLQFISIDQNVIKKWVPDKPDARKNIFVPTKRKRIFKNGIIPTANNDINNDDADNTDYDDDDAKQALVSINSFKNAIDAALNQDPKSKLNVIAKHNMNMISSTNNILSIHNKSPMPMLKKKIGFNNYNKSPSLTPAALKALNNYNNNNDNNNNSPFHNHPNVTRSDSILSTQSIYAIPDEIQSALVDYQNKVQNLAKQLQTERKRAQTLTQQKKTQADDLKEKEEKINQNINNYEKKVQFLTNELEIVNQAYYQLWIKQCNTKCDWSSVSKESYKTKAKFASTKKQLFQSKRKIDDLEDQIEELEKALFNEKNKANSADNNMNFEENKIFSISNMDDKKFELLDMKTEIASLKAKIASKDMIIEDLKDDNQKWIDANDDIFDRMTEAQQRLATEIEIFEDSKGFYENKLSLLRDKLQDNVVVFWEYDKRLNDITKLYCNKNNGINDIPKWINQPNISNLTSIDDYNANTNKKDKRDSMLMDTNGWGTFTPVHSQQNTLNDDDEHDDDSDSDDDDDNNNAFGAIDDNDDNDDNDKTDKNVIGNNGNDEFLCESDDDGITAFGPFGGSSSTDNVDDDELLDVI